MGETIGPMKKFIEKRFKACLWILALLVFSSGTLLFFLSDTPIGPLFWGIVYLFLISLMAFLVLTSIRYMRSKYLLKRIFAYVLAASCTILVLVQGMIMLNLDFWNPKLSGLSDADWQKDFDYLVDQIQLRHPSHLSTDNSAEFAQVVQTNRSQLPRLSTNQKIVAFNKTIAYLNDGHSSIWPGFEPINSHSFPIQFYFFDDGLYLIDSDRAHKEYIGSKVLKIGNSPVEDLYEKLSVLTGSENEMGKKVRFTMYATIAEVLQAEGVIKTVDELELLLETDAGNRRSITLEPISTDLWMFWSMINLKSKDTSPAFKNPRSDFYWFEYWDDSKTIYVQFNIVFDKLLFGESIATFSQRLNAFAKQMDFDRFIIDIRNNNGGNNYLLHPLIEVIRDNKKINRSGRLFTIIGRHTFSAAMNFAYALENQTKTLFVGEFAGASPNFYGDTPNNFLPNSGIKLILSTLYWQNSIAEDPRPSIVPDIQTTYTHTDFLNDRDPAIEAILEYHHVERPQVQLADSVHAKLEGVYHFSSSKLLTIKRGTTHGGQLHFMINDFAPISFADVVSGLYPISDTSFATDIKNVFLVHKQDSIYLDWNGIKKVIVPIDLGTQEAMEYIKTGRQESINRGFAIREPTAQDLDNWGYHFLGRGNRAIALNIFLHNARLYPASSRPYLGLAKIYLAMGKRKQASINVQKVLELDPSNIEALEVLEAIK